MKSLLPVLFALLILSSCRKKEENIAVESVTIDKGKTAEVRLGETLQLKATVLPENATSKEVTWNSSTPSKATVSEGLVTPLEEGETTISATAGGVTENCTVKVLPKFVAVSGISIDPKTATLLVNSTRRLTATITPENATNTSLTWSTSDATIAEVSTDGVVTAKSLGAATITVASVGNPAKTAICAITVTDREVAVARISVAPADTTLITGALLQLKPTIEPANATNVNVTYESSDAAKATVSESGQVTIGSTTGAATITVKSAADPTKTATCRLTLTKRVESITVSPNSVTLSLGQKQQLTTLVMPDEAKQTVKWKSLDESKATVTDQGEVTAVTAGEVRITATATDGSHVTGEATITVQAPISNAAITAITLGTENFAVPLPESGVATTEIITTFTATLGNAPHTIAADLTGEGVQVNITATEGAIIKIGDAPFTSGHKVPFSPSVTFSVTEEGKRGSKEYTLTITPYNKESNPYGIYTPAHLQDVRNALGEGFKLMNDLTLPAGSTGLAGISDYATAGWVPIGGENNPFTGTLDGAGHKIENLYANHEASVYVGLFGKVGSGATIKNLEVKTTIETGKGVSGKNTTGAQYSGVLAGHSEGTIEDCYTTGAVFASTVTTGSAYAGGLVGHAGGQVRRCYSTAAVNSSTAERASDSYAGGLAGFSNATINDCYATGKITANGGGSITSESYAGGLIGKCLTGNVNKCYATGEVTSVSSSESSQLGAYAGGLIGSCNNTINNCYARGAATASTVRESEDPINFSFAGGLSGLMDNSSVVSNCYAVGKASTSTSKSQWTGTFAGYIAENVTLTNCYRTNGYVSKEGLDGETDDHDKTRVPAKSLEDMKKSAFKDDLNKEQGTVWGQDGGKNDALPYLIGVGVGK